LLLQKITSLVVIVLILILHLILALWALSAGGVLERILAEQAHSHLSGRVAVGAVRIEPLKGLTIEGFEWQPATCARPLVQIDAITLVFDLTRLVAGVPAPREVLIDGPRVFLPKECEPLSSFVSFDTDGKQPSAWPDTEVRWTEGLFAMHGTGTVIEGIQGVLRCTGGEQTVELEELRGSFAQGTVAVQGCLQKASENLTFQVKVEGWGIICGEELEPLLEEIGVIRDYQAFQPEGAVDFVFESDVCRTPRISGRLQLIPRGGSAVYMGYPDRETGVINDGFPISASQLAGLISVRVPGQVEIEHLTGRLPGAGRVDISGTVVTTVEQRARKIDVQAFSAGLDEALIEAIERHAPEVSEALRWLEAHGRASGVVSLDFLRRITGQEQPARRSVTIEAQLENAGVRPRDFPLPVEQIDGTVHFHDRRCTFENLRGTWKRTQLRGAGRVDRNGLSLAIDADHVELDGELLLVLREAYAPMADLIESFRISGDELSVRFEYERSFGGASDASDHSTRRMLITVDLGGCSAHPVGCPVQLERLEGRVVVEVADTRVECIKLVDLRCSHRGSTLCASGLWRDGDWSWYELKGRDQKITGELLAALSILDDDLSQHLDGVTVQGSIGFDLLVDSTGLRLTLDPRLAELESPALPFPLRRMQGCLTWNDTERRLAWDGLVLGLPEGVLELDQGELAFVDGGRILRLQGRGRDLHLQKDLIPLLTSPHFGFVGLPDADGSVDIEEMHLQIVNGDDGRLRNVTGRMELEISDGAVYSGVDLAELYGRFSLDFSKPGLTGPALEMKGEGRRINLAFAGYDLRDMRLRFQIENDELEVSRLESSFYGGLLTGGDDTFRMRISPELPFEGHLALEGADLRRLLVRNGYAFRDISGVLEGSMGIGGRLTDIKTVRAQGRIKVEDGRLWKLPVFSSLLEVIGTLIGFADLPVFEKGSARFVWHQGIVTLDDAVLDSPLLTLNGDGDLTVDSANVRVQFALGPRIPILSDVIAPITNLIKRGIFNLRMIGPYDNMDVSYDSILTSPFGSPDVIIPVRYPPRRKIEAKGRF